MRVGYSSSHSDKDKKKKKKDKDKKKKKDKDKKKKKKRQQSILEKEIMSIMHKSMKAALDMALDDLLKDWK